MHLYNHNCYIFCTGRFLEQGQNAIFSDFEYLGNANFTLFIKLSLPVNEEWQDKKYYFSEASGHNSLYK